MDTYTGKYYENKQDAIDDGVPEERLIEIIGTKEQVSAISKAVKEKRRRQAKAARKARKKNR